MENEWTREIERLRKESAALRNVAQAAEKVLDAFDDDYPGSKAKMEALHKLHQACDALADCDANGGGDRDQSLSGGCRAH